MPANTDPQSGPATAGWQPSGRGRQAVALAGFLALSLAAWALASVPIILHSGGWFAGSTKAPWMPPGWMFRSMWMLLYVGVAVAAWLVWRKGELTGSTLAGYLAQLVLNAAWPLAFFGLFPVFGSAALWAAFLVIAGLAASLAFLTLRFGPVSPAAGLLMLPYLSWVVFSGSLNLYSAIHN
ncbi:tryptophan-rich sensory protein [Pseudarthrobacter phenanthrenivorans]|uniref:Tryptophan-rich sensory protein n=1 Tax=Pseudarthrobacter phenanthrenivorans TaxID=361575 RepID=A0A3B0G0H2_PSEPS|nr:TspO/MBR family protein [Pseudarthrobacter phenanthrenivorans]RKO24067.1 tryptophan-rich sensory protein [Pseudarthrobacter phenanthrenivorans]TPV53048.1 tryptophan-rich sensory protein [Pseudarthrobacter phenanthrenivorans]